MHRATQYYSIAFRLQLNGTGDTGELQKICAEHIASLVDLRWQLLGTESTGKATLSGITLTQDMLDLVRMSPLQWGAYVCCFPYICVFDRTPDEIKRE